MALRFEAKDKKLVDVLFTNDKFQVPRYQRPYAWDEDHISEFWNDLVTNDDPYFLGSLIFNREPLGSTGFIDIIDGQQRLLTVTIFMAVLRDIVASIDKATSQLIHRQDIVFTDRLGRESARITPGDTTVEYFRTYIQERANNILNSRPRTAELQRIKKNYEFLSDKINKINNELSKFSDNEDKLRYINSLREKVAELIVIQIQIDSEEDAYEIFETTNARGVDLSVADLLKNLIFKKIPAKEYGDFAKEVWQDITNQVESTNTELKKFLRYFWISKHSFVTEKKLFREIKRKITDWSEILGDLSTASDHFNKLLEGSEDDFSDYRNSNEIFDIVFALRLMRVSQCYVLLMSILRNYTKIKTDPRIVFRLIEHFTFKYSVICKRPGNIVEKIYSKYAIMIENAVASTSEKKISGRIQSIFSQLEKELKRVEPSRDMFAESFLAFSYKNSEKGRMLTKYILGKIDSFYRETSEQKIDFYNVNVEHILPQKPCEKWGLTKKDIKDYVNKIGNLTLLSKRLNSKVQNQLVKDKIEFYRKSELPIAKELVKTLEKSKFKWGEKEIENRQKSLATIAYEKIWNM